MCVCVRGRETLRQSPDGRVGRWDTVAALRVGWLGRTALVKEGGGRGRELRGKLLGMGPAAYVTAHGKAKPEQRDKKKKKLRRLNTPLLKIPVWWRRAVLPSLPWVVCFLSFFLASAPAAKSNHPTTYHHLPHRRANIAPQFGPAQRLRPAPVRRAQGCAIRARLSCIVYYTYCIVLLY